jgi:polar amino acid transport system substrate-binding protein
MPIERRKLLLASMALAATLAAGQAQAAAAPPAPGASARVDEIKERGTLRVAVLPEPPWLKQNTTGGSGEPFEGPAWMLARAYADALGVTVEPVPVSHETKVPILATGQVDMTIAPLSVTDARLKVADFVDYTTSALCFFGQGDNPRLAGKTKVDELDSPEITVAYFTGTPPEGWLPERLPQAKLRAVTGSGANAPVDEIMSGRADVAPIDKIAWFDIAGKVPGLVAFPPGDECLTSTELPTEVGLAIDKNQPEFLAWLREVGKGMQEQLTADELRLAKQ